LALFVTVTWPPKRLAAASAPIDSFTVALLKRE
jgi:hypothetical protein